MKKKVLFLSLLLFLSLGFAKSDIAEAAMHPWKKLPQAGSTCEVRAWTDYLSYSTRATSVDFYLESRGNCGTLSYIANANIRYNGLNAVSSTETGSFSFRTPIKKARLHTIDVRPTAGPLWVEFRKNGRHVGQYTSNHLSYPR
ncbi:MULTISPECIES: hypothetical protein [Bacillaceae]|uniref:hypothetical protein n=1 Tax=Shouchella oshimensis TaxID=290588 RepID=UPI0006EC004D|nr:MULTISPECIES: hypothetical protein [Bacillaceae]